MTSQNVCSTKRPYCFSLPERSPRHLIDRYDGDPVYYDACTCCDHFEGCQEANETKPRILTLNLKDQYFFDIDQGIKTEEYREAKHFWRARLQGKTFDVIEICRRYPSRGDTDNRLWFRFVSAKIVLMKWDNGGTTISGPTFVIKLGDRLEYPYQAMEAAHV